MLLESPRFILISRSAIVASPERVREALRIVPPSVAFVASDLDAKLTQELVPQVLGTGTPVAIVADFPFDLATINEGGAVVVKELPQAPE